MAHSRSESIEFALALKSYGLSQDLMRLAKYEGQLPDSKRSVRVRSFSDEELTLATGLLDYKDKSAKRFAQSASKTDHNARGGFGHREKEEVGLPPIIRQGIRFGTPIDD